MTWIAATAEVDSTQWTAESITTLVLSSLALLVSVITLVLNQWFRPRPHFEIQWDLRAASQNRYGTLIAICWIWNDGEATARNVRLNIRHPKVTCADADWHRWHEFEPGAGRYYLEVPLEPAMYTRGGLGPEDLHLYRSEPLPEAAQGLDDWVAWRREEVIRPTVEIKYRGRIRPVRWRAPNLDPMPMIGGC